MIAEEERDHEIYYNNRIQEKWEVSSRCVDVLCSEGRIPEVQKAGNTWSIPMIKKPADVRIKSRKSIKSKLTESMEESI